MTAGDKQPGVVRGWLASMRPSANGDAAADVDGAGDTGGKAGGRARSSSAGGSSVLSGGPHHHHSLKGGSLWTPEVAARMGYGKKGRAGSAYQWWILLLAGALALGSYIAWAVLVFRVRDTTEASLDALRVDLPPWGALRSILMAAAVAFPILTLAAVAVSLWRARLAHRLNIHAPDAAWDRSSRAYQVANVASSVLLYALFLLLLFSLGAMFVWAASGRAAHVGAYYAIKYVDPIWNGTASVVDASQNLVRNFVGLTSALPGVGRRLQEALPDYDQTQPHWQQPGSLVIIGGRRLTQADVAVLPPDAIEAGLAAARTLQQLPGIFNNLGGWLAGAASAINGVPMPRVNTAALPANLPFLPQLLPNGSSNPLFNTLRGVTDAVQGQLLNATGCPIYCVDLRNQSWIQDGCVCNLERVKAAYPHMSRVYGQAVAATIPLFLMLVSATWLLMHAASQWGRTRSEAKLMARIPHAARVGGGAGAGAGGAGSIASGQGVGSGGGSGALKSGMLADVPAKQQAGPVAAV